MRRNRVRAIAVVASVVAVVVLGVVSFGAPPTSAATSSRTTTVVRPLVASIGHQVRGHTYVTVACPGPQCPYTAPTPNEQGVINNFVARWNLDRAQPLRDFTYQGQVHQLGAVVTSPTLDQVAQAAAEYDVADNGATDDYAGPLPDNYAYFGVMDGVADEGAQTASQAEGILMLSAPHATGLLDPLPMSFGVGVAAQAGGAFTLVMVGGTTTQQDATEISNYEAAETTGYYINGETSPTPVGDPSNPTAPFQDPVDPSITVDPQYSSPLLPIVGGCFNDGQYLTFYNGDTCAQNTAATGVNWTINGPIYYPNGSGPQTPSAPMVSIASTAHGNGYWEADAAGEVFPFGSAQYYGSMAGVTLNEPVTHIVATPDGKGYWLVAKDGGAFSFGDAQFYGSMGGKPLNQPVVSMAPTPDNGGYWLVASDGGVFSFGDAQFHGSMGGKPLNQPVDGIVATSDGYFEVASDGGVFAFGNATFAGSLPGLHVSVTNIVGIAPSGSGYWLVASDGGIFSIGVSFYGSEGGGAAGSTMVGMAADPTGKGYWEVAANGSVYSFGSANYFGSVTYTPPCTYATCGEPY